MSRLQRILVKSLLNLKSGALQEELLSLIVALNNGMSHNTAVHDVAIVVRIHDTNRSRAARLPVGFLILHPLCFLANPVNGILPKNGPFLVAVMNTKIDLIPVHVSVRITAFASYKTSLLGLILGYADVNFKFLDFASLSVLARLANNRLKILGSALTAIHLGIDNRKTTTYISPGDRAGEGRSIQGCGSQKSGKKLHCVEYIDVSKKNVDDAGYGKLSNLSGLRVFKYTLKTYLTYKGLLPNMSYLLHLTIIRPEVVKCLLHIGI